MDQARVLPFPARSVPRRSNVDLVEALGNYAPIDPQYSYTTQAHAILRSAIVTGRLVPGTSLSEASIAKAIGISRTPVREALRLLVHEELICVYPQAGTVVAPMRLVLIEEGTFVRNALERENLAQFLHEARDEQLEEFREILAAQRHALDTKNLDQFYHYDEAMHRRAFELTQRGRVWELIERFKTHSDRARWMLLKDGVEHNELAYREHAQIVDRIIARDVDAALKALSSHIKAVPARILGIRADAPTGTFSL